MQLIVKEKNYPPTTLINLGNKFQCDFGPFCGNLTFDIVDSRQFPIITGMIAVSCKLYIFFSFYKFICDNDVNIAKNGSISSKYTAGIKKNTIYYFSHVLYFSGTAQFDGSSGYILIPPATTLQQITIAAWVYMDFNFSSSDNQAFSIFTTTQSIDYYDGSTAATWKFIWSAIDNQVINFCSDSNAFYLSCKY
jgi:hypothetical protein